VVKCKCGDTTEIESACNTGMGVLRVIQGVVSLGVAGGGARIGANVVAAGAKKAARAVDGKVQKIRNGVKKDVMEVVEKNAEQLNQVVEKNAEQLNQVVEHATANAEQMGKDITLTVLSLGLVVSGVMTLCHNLNLSYPFAIFVACSLSLLWMKRSDLPFALQ
jgi:hypothetical protein